MSMATITQANRPHNHWATFPQGSGKGEHERGLAPPLFFAPGYLGVDFQEQAIEIVLGDAGVRAAVLEEEIGQG